MATVGRASKTTMGERLMAAVGEKLMVTVGERLMATVGERLMATVGERPKTTTGEGLMRTTKGVYGDGRPPRLPERPAKPRASGAVVAHERATVMSRAGVGLPMHTVRRGRILHASKDHVWEVLDDFGGVWKYDPAVESSGIVNGVETGRGACRECVFHGGGRVEETIIAYAPGEGYTVAFTDLGSLPLVSNTVEVDVRAVDDHHSAVTFTASFRPKYGVLGWLLGRVVMERRFEKRFDAVLEGLAAHVRTGETVGRGGPTAPV
jgi:hypothetical protein